LRALFLGDEKDLVDVPVGRMVKASLKKSVGDLLLGVVPNGLRDFSKLEQSLDHVRFVVLLGDGVPRMSQGRCAVFGSPYYNHMLQNGREVEDEFQHMFSEDMSAHVVMFKNHKDRLEWKVRLYGWCLTKVPSSQQPLYATGLKDFITTPFEPCFTDVSGRMLRCASMYRGSKASKTIETYKEMFDTALDVANARMQNAGGSGLAQVLKAMPSPPATEAEMRANEKLFGAVLKERFNPTKVGDGVPKKGRGKSMKNLLVDDKANESSRRRVKREERSTAKAAMIVDGGEILDDDADSDFKIPAPTRKRSRKLTQVLDDGDLKDVNASEVSPTKGKAVRKDGNNAMASGSGEVSKLPYPILDPKHVLDLSESYPFEVVARQYDKLVTNWKKVFTNSKKFGDVLLAENPANILLSLTWEGPEDMLNFLVQEIGSGSNVYELYLGMSELANNIFRDVTKILNDYVTAGAKAIDYRMEKYLVVQRTLTAFIQGVTGILSVTAPPWTYELDLVSITRDAKRVVYSLGSLQSGQLKDKVQMYKMLYKVAVVSKRPLGGECYVVFPRNDMDDATRACVERITHSYEHSHYWCSGNMHDMERYLRVVESEYRAVSKEYGEVDLCPGKLKVFLGLVDP
jgi:hypothetical protein